MSFRFRPVTAFANGSFLLAIILCYPILAAGQQSSYPLFTPLDSAEVRFDQIIGEQNAAIVNGPEYRPSFNGRKSHPFFQSPESSRGSLQYENDLYQNIDLLYDIYGDILVLKSSTPLGAFFITLDKKKIQRFDLHQHHFKKFSFSATNKNGIYFDVLFEQKQFAVLVRRSKTERIEKGVRDYLQIDAAYILNEERWIKINGKGSFSKTIKKNQRKELTAFIKTNHIKLRKQKDEDLMKLGAFCYSLKERE